MNDNLATQGVIEHGANGLYWAMDNWIYVSEHSWDVHPNKGKFEVVLSLNRGQRGLIQDDAGRLFRDVNTDPAEVKETQLMYSYRKTPGLNRKCSRAAAAAAGAIKRIG